MLLICFDGSEGARAALDEAARLFPGQRALVACYWQPFAESSKRFAIDILELVQDPDSINEREMQLVEKVAVEGAATARALGLDAESAAVRIDGPIEEAILGHAEEIGASAIILGSRSRSKLRSLILGDVANEVAQRATRPVFLVSSSGLASARRSELTRDL
jgi:nucleotide-binding universal stress UspA family protein